MTNEDNVMESHRTQAKAKNTSDFIVIVNQLNHICRIKLQIKMEIKDQTMTTRIPKQMFLQTNSENKSLSHTHNSRSKVNLIHTISFRHTHTERERERKRALSPFMPNDQNKNITHTCT